MDFEENHKEKEETLSYFSAIPEKEFYNNAGKNYENLS